ncbi:class IV lanthionine synthetase LanL [Actinacidiphila alni]|uniref:class IV lanthionine synthetase LanL n=1 Tax=Actinacidiphila alni TaxID=380248 RepID=UPI000B80572A|nr:class IV lanthionine synthetase LanL [Actinacidiphila alni]
MVHSVLATLDARDWRVEEDGVWCRVTPPHHEARVQGWKLHVSATRLSAPEVLHRAAEVLVAAGCAFKTARDLQTVEEMTSGNYDRAQCGKIITAYPRDDDRLRELAALLDDATAGLPGPAILSDRPYRKGSLVHYRYGGFSGVRVLGNDGSFDVRLRAPDGTLTDDHRKAWFSPPPWAELPFPGDPGRPATVQSPRPVLLADRFVVREAIRHSARGGVYRAQDQHTGAEVIVKQARAHVAVNVTGEDARDCLRREAANLVPLTGLCTELVASFEKDGHAFLVQSLVPGQTLASWVTERRAEPGFVPVPQVLALAEKLCALLGAVHERGIVYQDFTPNNIMVTPDDRLVLIDAEWATTPGSSILRVYTPGFGAPEQIAEPRVGPAYGTEVDRYALGGVLYFLATGIAPGFAQDGRYAPSNARLVASCAGRPAGERIALVLSLVGEERPAARLLTPAILGLMAERPEDRWTLNRLAAFLADAAAEVSEVDKVTGRSTALTGKAVGTEDTGPETESAPDPVWLSGGCADRPVAGREIRAGLVDDGLAHLLRDMADPEGPATRLWSGSAFGDGTDPVSVQYGAAGVLGTLVRADRALDRPELRDAVRRVADWIDRRRTAVPQLLPGLYFGRSGAAWALYDAARHLGDDTLAEHATDLALSLPVVWPNPDICHGAAGSGLAHLKFWQATGRPEFLDRVAECAGSLAAAADRTADRVIWQVPPDFDSKLAGIRHLGFAHGVAGIGAFLLAAADATGDSAALDLAVTAGDTLAAEAERGQVGARWRSDVDEKPGTGLIYHWCSGSSGVGTFLLRLWRATGDERHLTLAREAAQSVRAAAWTSPTAVCHGLAGDGEFLLDLAAAQPDGPYRAWAEDLATVLYARHAVVGGLRLVPDENATTFTAGYQTGTAGVISFLLRLDHGGPRPWMADRPAALEGTPTAHR